MIKLTSFSFFSVLLLLSTAFVYANETVTKKPAPPTFIPYDNARVLERQQRQSLNYLLALSPYKKRANRWRPETALRLQGQLFQETHEVPSGYDELDVLAFYQSQISAQAELLFECDGRDCGESNSWANDHFRIKQLYGLDQYQFYRVYKADNAYTTLYVVRRGNRRVTVQLDTLVANE